jgi:hypothetical protein
MEAEMAIQTCPTDVVHAPASRVWELITVPRHYPTWSDSLVVDAPARAIVPGDRIRLTTGPANAFKVMLEIIAVRAPEELTIDVHLPFGVLNHEVIRIGPITEQQCRVTFN